MIAPTWQRQGGTRAYLLTTNGLRSEFSKHVASARRTLDLTGINPDQPNAKKYVLRIAQTTGLDHEKLDKLLPDSASILGLFRGASATALLKFLRRHGYDSIRMRDPHQPSSIATVVLDVNQLSDKKRYRMRDSDGVFGPPMDEDELKTVLFDYLVDRYVWNEDEHPRGQPENAGEFREKDGAGSSRMVNAPAPTTWLKFRQSPTKIKADRSEIYKAIQDKMIAMQPVEVEFDEAAEHFDPAMRAQRVDEMADEVNYQLEAMKESARIDDVPKWYEETVRRATAWAGERYLPEILDKKHPAYLDMFYAGAAVLSLLRHPDENWGNAMVAFGGMLDDQGDGPPQFPMKHSQTGELLGVPSTTMTLANINDMLRRAWDEHGDITDKMDRNDATFDDVSRWLLGNHTRGEMAVQRANARLPNGQYIYLPKNKERTPSKFMPAGNGRANVVQPGYYTLGEKIGNFYANIMGKGTSTIDSWMTRYIARSFGKLGDERRWDKTNNVTSRPTAAEYKAMQKVVADVTARYNEKYGNPPMKDDKAGQAVMWFFEQELWDDFGANSKPKFFTDAPRLFRASWHRRGAGGVPGDTAGDGHPQARSRKVARRRIERRRKRREPAKYAQWDESKHPRGQPENAGEFAEVAMGEKPAQFASDLPPEPPAVEFKLLPNEMYSDPVWKAFQSQAETLGTGLDEKLKTAANNAIVDFMLSPRDQSDILVLEQELYELGVGGSFNVSNAVKFSADQPERAAVLADIDAALTKAGETNEEIKDVLSTYSWKDFKNKYMDSGDPKVLMEAAAWSVTSADEMHDIVNDVLAKHGQEKHGVLDYEGQFQLPGFGTKETHNKQEHLYKFQYSVDSVAKLENFIKENLPEGAHVIENTGWANPEMTVQGWDVFTTPSGEQFSLTDESKKMSYPTMGDDDTYEIDERFLDEVPRKMGWDEFTTGLWEESRNDADMNDAPTTEEAQDKEAEAAAEQEAEQEAEDESDDDGDSDDDEESETYYHPDLVGHQADLKSLNLGDPEDAIDQSQVKKIQDYSTKILDNQFFGGGPESEYSGGVDSDVIHEFWEYQRGNYGSLNDDLKGLSTPDEVEENKNPAHHAIDRMIEAVGEWPVPQTVFRGLKGGYAEQMVKKAKEALATGSTISEASYAHTSFDAHKSLEFSSGVMMVIKSKTGAWTAPFTHYTSENEVLKSPFTEYKPIKVYEKEVGGEYGRRKMTIIQVEEMQSWELKGKHSRPVGADEEDEDEPELSEAEQEQEDKSALEV